MVLVGTLSNTILLIANIFHKLLPIGRSSGSLLDVRTKRSGFRKLCTIHFAVASS